MGMSDTTYHFLKVSRKALCRGLDDTESIDVLHLCLLLVSLTSCMIIPLLAVPITLCSISNSRRSVPPQEAGKKREFQVIVAEGSPR